MLGVYNIVLAYSISGDMAINQVKNNDPTRKDADISSFPYRGGASPYQMRSYIHTCMYIPSKFSS